MREDIHKTDEPKARYCVRKWAAYNEGPDQQGERDDMDK
ncbi:MAG: hypothetical protein E5299_00780 [Burkholderia gladioli]|nr:MAG: hypothetical protein E5299_00780 [Burkholderia gladioli]